MAQVTGLGGQRLQYPPRRGCGQGGGPDRERSEAKPSGCAESGTTTLSTCNYTAGAETFTVLLRQSPDSTLAEGISGLKASPEMTGPMEEVAAPGGKGFWAPRLKTFTLLTADGKRLISVTPPGVRLGGKSDSDEVLKQKALALAEAERKPVSGSGPPRSAPTRSRRPPANAACRAARGGGSWQRR